MQGAARWLCVTPLAMVPVWTLNAQMVDRPDTVWGRVDHQPEGLVIGGVETLAGSLILQLLILAAVAALVLRKRTLLRRLRLAEDFEVHRLMVKLGRVRLLLLIAVYVLSPLLAIVSVLVGLPHSLAGVDAATISMTLFFVTYVVAAADQLIVPG